MPARSRLLSPFLLISALAAVSLAACGDAPPPSVGDRLWLSGVPAGPRAPVHAFAIAEVRGRQLGTFYHGSAYRGQHDAFRWRQQGERDAKIEFLQDGKTHKVRVKECTPSRGFDYCIELQGDPTGAGRYQSRKRWAIPRRGNATVDAAALMLEFAEQDDDLASLIADAPDPS